jgi:hypothetical protein
MDARQPREEARGCSKTLKRDAGDGDDGGGDGSPRKRTSDLQRSSKSVLLQAVSSCVESYHDLDQVLNSTIGLLHPASNNLTSGGLLHL